MDYKKIFEALEDALSSKDNMIEYYRKENENLKSLYYEAQSKLQELEKGEQNNNGNENN